jgi:alanyl-tRNA synthetase
MFRLVSETGVAAGVRRIECVTGGGAFMQIKQLEHEVQELAELLKTAPSELVARTRRLLSQLKDRERELEQVRLKMASGAKDEATVRTVAGIQVHAQRVDGMEGGELRTLADQLRDKMKSGVIALGGVKDGKVSLLVVVTKDLTATLKAGELIKEMAAAVGGTGGGRPEMAQAGGKNPEGLAAALDKIFGLVERSAGK